MNLSPMRFKNYVWPHNPKVYEIGFHRNVAVHHVPFGRDVLESMGMERRILRGEGEFSGPGAYQEFQRLATVFYEETPGILVHPVWQTAKAWFVELRVKQEPREDYVAYSFEFWDCYDGYRTGIAAAAARPTGSGNAAAAVNKPSGSSAQQYYTVVKGDTLYAIANRAGMSLSALTALNPQIRNINLIHPGDRVRIA